ncbi:MAG: hypothetical protein DME75_13015 [Verrucomicrobia bacterium]|nr:MAG: hypothetical protein DME75_13015 [Verrucomicrobiota bacterium]
MAVLIPTGAIKNLQQIEAVVAGPDDANRLFIIDGQFDSRVEVETHGGSSTQKETFSVLVGPVFNKHQFSRAIATASFTKTGFTGAFTGAVGAGAGFGGAYWYILGVDADWDDESGQVELRIEAEVEAGMLGASARQYVAIMGFAFHVTILAAVPAA